MRENEISLRKWSGGAAQLRTSEVYHFYLARIFKVTI